MIAAMSSVSNTCILTMQDLLGLGSEGRMNTPSTLGENWQWRVKDGYLTEKIKNELFELTKIYARERKS